MPGALGGAGAASPAYVGAWYLASSSWLPPPGALQHHDVRLHAREPVDAIHQLAPDGRRPSTSSPSATKNAVAAGRSSTTTPMCSKRWTVMNGLLVSWAIRSRPFT